MENPARGRLGSSLLSDTIEVSLIVARSRNNVIGRDGDLPWRLKADLAHFKATTLGAPILMGRKTWESLPRHPLPGRTNIVVTRNWTYAAEGARVYSNLTAALAASRAIAQRDGKTEVFVIGGAELFKSALPLASRLYLTEVDADVDGDILFEDYRAEDWTEIRAERVSADADNDHDFVIRVLQRMH